MHHLTHINNLISILKKGLNARNFAEDFIDTSDSNMIKERKSISGIDLNDYVPFHINFFQIKHEIGYNYRVLKNNGKNDMVFIIFNPPNDGTLLYYLYHPASCYARRFENFDVYTDQLRETYSNLKNRNERLDYSNHEVQQFLMSEILIYKNAKTSDIKKILVFSLETKRKVENILTELNINHIIVEINTNFFGR